MSMYTDFITDAQLIAAAHPSASRAAGDGSRISYAVYANGDSRYFASVSCGHNRITAREYGTRILHSALVSCNWVKTDSEVEA